MSFLDYMTPDQRYNRLKRERRRANKRPSAMIRRVFGRLTVLRRWSPGGAGHQTKWECRCDCGRTTIVDYANLLTGNTKSCGHHHAGRVHGRFASGHGGVVRYLHIQTERTR